VIKLMLTRRTAGGRGWGQAWCRGAAAAFLGAACTAFAPVASASVLLDGAGSHVVSYGGWSVWNRLDASTHKYALVARSPAGVIEVLAVAESEPPFEIEMGPHGAASTVPVPVVVYPQCTTSGSFPECTIYSVQLGVTPASARALLPLSTAEADGAAPWRDELVYFSLAEHDHPQWLWETGPGSTSAVPLPQSKGAKSSVGSWNPGEAAISGLRMVSKNTIIYATRQTTRSFAMSGLWLQSLTSNHRVLIDQTTAGAAATCEQSFFPAAMSGSWVYAYLHDCAPSAQASADRWTRYKLDSHWKVIRTEIARASLVTSTGDETFNSAALVGAGVEWGNETGVHLLSTVHWRTIKHHKPETFCNAHDPLC
jgi:hypothetical protein